MAPHQPGTVSPIPDPLDFRRLFDTHFDELTRYAYRYVRSIDDAKDLVHDAFLRLWRQRETVDFRTSVRAYLFTTVRHLALDRLRRQRVDERWRGRVVEATGRREAETAADDPAADLAGLELAAAVEAAVAALPPRQREVLRLRWHQHASYHDIAQTLGISAKTVEHHMSRALTSLRSTLQHFLD